MRSDSNTPPDDQIKLKFNVLPWGYSYERESSVILDKNIGEILETILDILPEELLVKSEIRNISGIISDGGKVLSVGYLRKDKQEEAQEESGHFEISSKFARFEGSQAIIFSLGRFDSLGSKNPRELILNNSQITSIKLSLEWYERRWASLFGLFPVATQSLSLTVIPGSYQIKISVRRQSTKHDAKELGEKIFNKYFIRD